MRAHWLNRSTLVVALLLIAAVTVAQDKPLPLVTPESDIGLEAGQLGPDAAWPGPDGFGYSGQTVAYSWIEISSSGTVISGLTDDNYLGPFPIGFTFNFYGTAFTDFYAASNGYITLGAGVSDLSNDCPLPNNNTPNNMIALMWDDLDPGDTGDLAYYQTFATCPIGSGACLVVQYDDFCHYPGGASCPIAGTWEAILFEDTGNVILQYEDAGVEEGSGSTEGIEGNDFAAGHGLTYACDTATSVVDGTAIEFMFPSGLMLSPDMAAKQACEGGFATYTLSLANYTGADATFDLSYTSAWEVIGPASLFVADMTSVDFDVTILIPCGGVDDMATVAASGGGYSDSSILTTSVTAGGFTEWEAIDSINSVGRSRPAAAAVGGKVYLFGGEISGGREDTVEMFDPAVGVWVDMLGLMPVPASNICAAAIGTDIYIPGGYDASSTYMTQLQVYHTATDTWETVTTDPYPLAISGVGCAALDGKLYVFGGTTGTYTNAAYVYDPAAAAGTRWTALPNMTYTRAYFAGAAVNGKVYAVGGRDGTVTNFNYVEAFDPADGLWHTVTPMNVARGGGGAMVWGDQLVACGGGWSTYLTSCESYDTTQGYAGTWTTLPQAMLQGRRTYGYASLPDALYAVAGYNGTFLTSAERLPAFLCPPCTDTNIDVSPLNMSASQLPNTITQQTLTIGNTGGSGLIWNIFEEAAVKAATAGGAEPKSLTGSFVTFDPSAGGNTCYTPGAPGTFCFRDESFSPDYAYVYNVWQKFPADWTIANVYVQGTPWCDNGSWGTFSWVFETPPYEVNITHNRYQGSGGAHCVAYYCFDVTAGAGPGDAGVSWYWSGDDYGNPPDHPCSSDQYTPASATDPCDEWVNPLATVPACGGGVSCTNPADVPWLSELPTNGTTAAGASTPVEVTFDSTGLATGTYSANLCVESNDPDPGPGNGTGLVVVPVVLDVTGTANPAISLAKTVGTVNGVCATTDAITVSPGTTVYYCYEVTNIGNVELTTHDLADDQVGTIFSGTAYVLAPGASVNTVTLGVTVSAVINTTTTNTATWTGHTVTGLSAQATDSATVTVEFGPEIDVTPTSMTASLLVGTTETQVLTIANTGDAVLDWTVGEAAAAKADGLPQMAEPAAAGDASVAQELVGAEVPYAAPEAIAKGGTWAPPEVVLYDNGPLVTHPGGGAGGMDASALQTALGMNTYGAGAQQSAGNRVAEDVVVPGQWYVDTITFFAYQTGSGTTSTITGLNLQIWDGPPNAGGTVIWGNTTTNIMASTAFSNIYRVLDTALTNADRPIMAVVGTVGTMLPAGTYWLDWQFNGTLSSGPWQPPISILGQTTTGNAMQYTSTGWANLTDTGTLTPQGLPFIIDGTASACQAPSDIAWLSESPTAGTTAAGGTSPVDVTFDATVVGVGTYEALLCVFSNDPNEPIVEVPVTMEVVIPVELMGISIE